MCTFNAIVSSLFGSGGAISAWRDAPVAETDHSDGIRRTGGRAAPVQDGGGRSNNPSDVSDGHAGNQEEIEVEAQTSCSVCPREQGAQGLQIHASDSERGQRGLRRNNHVLDLKCACGRSSVAVQNWTPVCTNCRDNTKHAFAVIELRSTPWQKK